MAGKTYLWIEDRKGKSGYMFWQALVHEACPDVIVESKKNNSELVKAVKALSDTDNKYIIVFDNSFDNLQVYQEHKKLKKYVAGKQNVQIMNVICFEYILLEFDKLIEWIYAPGDELMTRRERAIDARQKMIDTIRTGELDYKSITEVMAYDVHLDEHNIEQLSAKLLFDLTRNTGFEVSKGNIGDCWIKSCCEWAGSQSGECGLNGECMSVQEKMRSIYYGTCLHGEFERLGLEVLL